jgi:hypothetical protein
MTDSIIVRTNERANEAVSASLPSSALAAIPAKTQDVLLRMFANPYLLENHEKASLVEQLRGWVGQNPEVSELRVLLGMALCVNLEAQAAMEELGEAVALAPNSFIAHLKMGELWMRLRVCEKAENHTHQAALLAQNPAQSELARRQAATLRTMMREGIERGGYKSPFAWIGRLRRLWARNRDDEALATVDVG